MRKIGRTPRRLILAAAVILLALLVYHAVLQQRLMDAMWERDYHKMEQALHCGAKIHGSTLLSVWRTTGDLSLIEFCLQHGADVNTRDRYGDTLLMIAVGKSPDSYIHSRDCIQLFLEYGADIEAESFGETALEYAVRAGNHESAELLLAHGARVDPTVFSNALKSDPYQYDTIRALLTALQRQDESFQCDPLLEATLLGKTEQTIQLWRIQAQTLTAAESEPILFYAAAFCGPDALDAMLQGKCDYTNKDIHGDSMLEIAARYENESVVDYLLRTNTEPENLSIRAAFDEAVMTGNIPIMTALHQAGAAPEVYVNKQWDYVINNPLSDAVAHGSPQSLDLLIDWGAPCNEFTVYLAMEEAIRRERIDLLQYFTERGFDPGYDRYWENGELSLLEPLLSVACKEHRPAAVSYLLGYDQKSEHIWAAFEYAVRANDLDCIKALAESAKTDCAEDFQRAAIEAGSSREILLYLEQLSRAGQADSTG